MKNLFFVFVLFSFSLQAQSSSPDDSLVFSESVPDYLQKAIESGQVKVNGTQTFTSTVEPVSPNWTPLPGFTPRLVRNSSSVLYYQRQIMGNHDIEDTCVAPPNVVKLLTGIRGKAFGDGELTAEQVMIGLAR